MRAIPLSVHSALEMLAAPAIMAAPFVLGFDTPATVATVLVGALLFGLSLQAGNERSLPLSAHSGFDYALGFAAIVGGLVLGLVTEDAQAGVFLVGVGAAQVALAAFTRFSAPRGA